MRKGIGAHKLTKLTLLGLIVLSFLYLILIIYQASSLKQAVAQRQQELISYQNEGLDKLTTSKVKLERQLAALQMSLDEITGIFTSKSISKMPQDPGDSLKFKEELQKVRAKLKEDGTKINFQFPFWLGFDKFEQDIPTFADLPVRVKQLELVKNVGGLMLQAGVTEITEIQFGDVKDISIEGSKEIIYKEFPLKIVFKCKNESLIRFLHMLSTADVLYKIGYINLKTSVGKADEKGDLSVESIIVAFIFP